MNQPDPKRGLKVTIDPHRCIANGMCTRTAPGILTIDEETGVAVLNDEDGSATVEQIFAGARACPTQAIIIEQYDRRVVRHDDVAHALLRLARPLADGERRPGRLGPRLARVWRRARRP